MRDGSHKQHEYQQSSKLVQSLPTAGGQ